VVFVAIILTLLGAIIGMARLRPDEAGLIFGGLSGFVLGYVLLISERLKQAEAALARLEQRLGRNESDVVPVEQQRAEERAPEVEEEEEGQAEAAAAWWPEEQPSPVQSVPVMELPDIDIAEPARGHSLFDTFLRFFTDGNVVVRVGIVVLFFGVAFLVKYAAEHSMFPIELRLAGAAFGALLLIGAGWRLRQRRTVYALLLQGGGIGIFYITVFGAAKLYHLLPMGMAFGLMVAIVALSSALALLQDSRSLAAFGLSGGFLAPVLTSTGGGSHVMLFSYYALLNAGILGIAWFKAWRELNLLGFAFTFVIGSLWGLRYYVPQHFATTEPFLILFFLFYVAIAVLFALRSPLKLRGYVDASLVFGVPVVGFALQAGLVRDFEYGMAWSSLALALFYIILASALWRRRIDGMRLLTEAFLALGVAFATLTIPLALDGRWTAAAWALEGAAMLWIGIRQQRLLPRIAGLLLQLGAGFSFMLVVGRETGSMPVLNGICLGSVLIALAGLFSSFFLQRYTERLREQEQPLHWLMLGWGLLWWLGAGMHEIDRFVPWAHRFNTTLLFITVTAAALLWLWRRYDWRNLRYPLLLLLPGMALLSLNVFLGSLSRHFFADWGVLPWLLAFAVQYRILWRMEVVFSDKPLRFGHSATLWLLLAILGWEGYWLVGQLLAGHGVWAYVSNALIPAVAILIVLGPAQRLAWPMRRFATTYQGEALLPVAVLLWLWVLLAAGQQRQSLAVALSAVNQSAGVEPAVYSVGVVALGLAQP